jgi:hypothetical protein
MSEEEEEEEATHNPDRIQHQNERAREMDADDCGGLSL